MKEKSENWGRMYQGLALLICNHRVMGSIPIVSTKMFFELKKIKKAMALGYFYRL
jgi:hypothetical protein